MNHQHRIRIPPFARSAFGGRSRLKRRFSDVKAGNVWEAQVRARIAAIRAGGELESLGAVKRTQTFRRLAAAWLDQLEVRPATMAWYKHHLRRRLTPAFGDIQVTSINEALLVAYRIRRKAGGCGARALQSELAVALRVLRWARRAGYHVDESAFRVAAPEVRPERERRFDPAAIEALLEAAGRGPAPNKNKGGRKKPETLAKVAVFDRAVIEVLRRTGLRAGELRAMSVDWIRWEERRLVVPHDEAYSPKGGRSRSIPLEAALIAILEQHLGGRPAGRVFEPARPGRPRGRGHHRGTGIDVQKLVSRVARAAGTEITAHDLRHYAISRWVEMMPAGNYSLADVQAWAGHASIRTTELYLHAAGGRWRAHAEALDRAGVGSELGSASSQGHLRVVRG